MSCIQLRGYQRTFVVEQSDVLSALNVRMHHCWGVGQSCEDLYNNGTYISRPRPRLAVELPTEVSRTDRLSQSEELSLLPSFAKRGKRV
jgi:hypothetical protein